MERKELNTGAMLRVRGHPGGSRVTARRALRRLATPASPLRCAEVGEDASGLRSPQVGPRGLAGDSPARECGCGADDHGVAVGGHPAADEQQRRRGNAATAESW